jgi:hypothetical protein
MDTQFRFVKELNLDWMVKRDAQEHIVNFFLLSFVLNQNFYIYL